VRLACAVAVVSGEWRCVVVVVVVVVVVAAGGAWRLAQLIGIWLSTQLFFLYYQVAAASS
jgi:hypothetical protein